MILYIENEAINYSTTQKIIQQFPKFQIIYIDNYKNIFDKTIPYYQENSIIIAKLKANALSKIPLNYWHIDNWYFFKTSLNCIFDCSYCYLKWAFKNNIQVYFVNYEDIKKQIEKVIDTSPQPSPSQERELEQNHPLTPLLARDKTEQIRFYSSDYSDNLWANKINNFLEEFVPFFENFENTMMEIRSKSTNINDILKLWFVPKNTEFAFSLNPQELIEKYEHKTPSLDKRIEIINILINKWYKIWLRFLPLLEVNNYEQIYTDFVNKIKEKIDISKIHSSFATWLLYTKADYNNILKKYPNLDILYKLKVEKDWFVRGNRKSRDFFYKLFKDLDKNCKICLDE